MIKRIISVVVTLLSLSLFLAACASEESINERWHTLAEETGVILQSNRGQSISFSENGMSADYNQISEEDPHVFPFEKEKIYSTYTVIKEDDNIIIEADNDKNLKYVLKIKGDRLYEDDRHNITYTTDSYLLESKE